MKPQEKTKLILCLAKELDDAISAFENAKKQAGGVKPRQGDGSEYEKDGYGYYHRVKEGLRQSATLSAIGRKIIMLREQLNELRKDLNA